MKRFLQFIIVIFLLSGCKRIYMYNMVGSDERVDITDLIEKENYEPIYCGEEICQLINPSPHRIKDFEASFILEQIISKYNLNTKSNSIINADYKYTYFITYFPVDVYELKVKCGDSIIYTTVKREKDFFMLPDVDGKP